MKVRKKYLISVLVTIISIIIASMTVFADTIYTQGYFNYRIEEKSAVITNYFGDEKEVTVPAMVAGYPVSKIAADAFAKNDVVEHINLPDTVMEVEAGAIRAGISVTYDSNTAEPKESMPKVELPSDEVISDDQEMEANKTLDAETEKNQKEEFSMAGAEEDLDAVFSEIENSETDSAKTPEESATEALTEKESTVSSEPASETDQETETETEEQTEKSAETETETAPEAMEQEEKHASNTSWLWVVVAAVVLAALYGRKTGKK